MKPALTECRAPPQYTPLGGSWPQLDFNVSHQAGLATLVGVCIEGGSSNDDPDSQVFVGCDIVAPHERGDMAAVGASDFEDYTSVYSNIFSEDELWYAKFFN
jgi:4'-phosphopantetheinyl transferase